MLPLSVLEAAASEMTNFAGSGMSVMEMSHRSKVYLSIFEEVKESLKKALSVPDTHEILFMQGGATFQFSAVPLNLMGEDGSADYAITGNFASVAMNEAKKYGAVNIAASSEDKNHTYIPAQSEIKTSNGASYFYYCANNTIYGTEWKYIPSVSAPLVCDMSSSILSKPVDVPKFGVIFAGVQKNMAPAGMAVVIIDKALAGQELKYTPRLMSYKVAIEKDSMDNTPPCYTIYMLGLVLKWLETQGGVAGMEKLKTAKAKLLYDYLDESALFSACVPGADARSDMNVTFRAATEELDKAFVKDAAAHGFENLAGHRSVGGMRASIYNAMPEAGVAALVKFMNDFELKNK
jgi:phosphoserine aminotransferase